MGVERRLRGGSMGALAWLACASLLSALPTSAFWTRAQVQEHTASLPNTATHDAPLAHAIPLPRHSSTVPRHRTRHSTRKPSSRRSARHGTSPTAGSIGSSTSTATSGSSSSNTSSSSDTSIEATRRLSGPSQEQPLISHCDPGALKRFGVPGVATYLLEFDVEDGMLTELNVRTERARSPGCAAGGMSTAKGAEESTGSESAEGEGRESESADGEGRESEGGERESRESEGGWGEGSRRSSGTPSSRRGWNLSISSDSSSSRSRSSSRRGRHGDTEEGSGAREEQPAACPRFTPCRDSGMLGADLPQTRTHLGHAAGLAAQGARGSQSGIPGLDLSACFAPRAQAPFNPTSALRLRSVYVNWQGVVFTNSTLFNFDDCTLPRDTRYRSKHSHRRGSPVVHLRRAYSLIHHWGRNFYHNMLEVLPQFLNLAAFLKEDPGLPILMKPNHYREYLKYGKNVTGIDASTLNAIFPSTPEVLIFVEELIQPHMPVCLLADVPMIASLREHFFLRPQGLPFLSPNLEPRYTRSLPPAAQEALPEDWKVVVFLRRGKKRAMWSNREFFKGVRGVFEKERIRVLKAHLGLSAAMELYQSTRLFICVHGSALVNSIFMPKGSFIFEIRLKEYNIPVYEKMAPGVGLNYYYTMADGGKGTFVKPNMTHVNEVLLRIRSAMQQQQKQF